MGLTVEGNPPLKPVSEYTVIGKSLQELRHRFQSRRKRNVGHRCSPSRHAARAHGPSENARLDAGLRRAARQNQISQRASHRERQSRRSRRAHRMGSHPSRAASRRRHQVERLERPPRQRATLRLTYAEDADWTTTPVTKSDVNKGDVARSARAPQKKLTATYQLPYMKHAPMGPTMALADVKPDGTVHIYTHNQNPQALARRNRARCSAPRPITSSCTRIREPATTADPTAATLAPKTKP